MVYYDQSPPEEERPPGCLDALILTRAVFAVLFWPLVAMAAALTDAALIFLLFVTKPLLALIPIAVTVVVLWLVSRWDQRRHRPPGL